MVLPLVLQLIGKECDRANAKAITGMARVGIPDGKGVFLSHPISKKHRNNRRK